MDHSLISLPPILSHSLFVFLPTLPSLPPISYSSLPLPPTSQVMNWKTSLVVFVMR